MNRDYFHNKPVKTGDSYRYNKLSANFANKSLYNKSTQISSSSLHIKNLSIQDNINTKQNHFIREVQSKQSKIATRIYTPSLSVYNQLKNKQIVQIKPKSIGKNKVNGINNYNANQTAYMNSFHYFKLPKACHKQDKMIQGWIRKCDTKNSDIKNIGVLQLMELDHVIIMVEKKLQNVLVYLGQQTDSGHPPTNARDQPILKSSQYNYKRKIRNKYNQNKPITQYCRSARSLKIILSRLNDLKQSIVDRMYKSGKRDKLFMKYREDMFIKSKKAMNICQKKYLQQNVRPQLEIKQKQQSGRVLCLRQNDNAVALLQNYKVHAASQQSQMPDKSQEAEQTDKQKLYLQKKKNRDQRKILSQKKDKSRQRLNTKIVNITKETETAKQQKYSGNKTKQHQIQRTESIFKSTCMSDYLPVSYNKNNRTRSKGYSTLKQHQFSQAISCGKKILTEKPVRMKKNILSKTIQGILNHRKTDLKQIHSVYEGCNTDFGDKKRVNDKQIKKKLKRIWKARKQKQDHNNKQQHSENKLDFFENQSQPQIKQEISKDDQLFSDVQLQSIFSEKNSQQSSSNLSSNYGKIKDQRQSDIEKAILLFMFNKTDEIQQQSVDIKSLKRQKLAVNKIRKSRIPHKTSLLNFKKTQSDNEQKFDLSQSQFGPLLQSVAAKKQSRNRKIQKQDLGVNTGSQTIKSGQTRLKKRVFLKKNSDYLVKQQQKLLNQFFLSQEKSLNIQSTLQNSNSNSTNITFGALKNAVNLSPSVQQQNWTLAVKILHQIENFRDQIGSGINQKINIENETPFCSLFWRSSIFNINQQFYAPQQLFSSNRLRYIQTSFSKAKRSNNFTTNQDILGIDIAKKMCQISNQIIQKELSVTDMQGQSINQANPYLRYRQ